MTEFCVVAPNIYGYLVWKFLHVTLVSRILRFLLDLWKMCALLDQFISNIDFLEITGLSPTWGVRYK